MTTIDLGKSLFASMVATVVDRSGVGVVVFDRDLRFVYANDVASQVNGRSPADHLGRLLSDVLPDVGPELSPVLHDLLETNTPLLNAEVSGETPAAPGELHYWMASFVPFVTEDRPEASYLAAVFVDISETRRAEHRLTQVMDGLFTFVGLCLPDGTVLEANETALDSGGLGRQDVVGKPFWDTYWWNYSPAVQERLRAAFVEARDGALSRFDVQIRVAGGRLITIDFQLVPVFEAGKVVAVVPSGLDITERVANRTRIEALALLSQQLNATIERGRCGAAVRRARSVRHRCAVRQRGARRPGSPHLRPGPAVA